jgi:hypothetical protein
LKHSQTFVLSVGKQHKNPNKKKMAVLVIFFFYGFL